jgi:hypothetical protein
MPRKFIKVVIVIAVAAVALAIGLILFKGDNPPAQNLEEERAKDPLESVTASGTGEEASKEVADSLKAKNQNNPSEEIIDSLTAPQ